MTSEAILQDAGWCNLCGGLGGEHREGCAERPESLEERACRYREEILRGRATINSVRACEGFGPIKGGDVQYLQPTFAELQNLMSYTTDIASLEAEYRIPPELLVSDDASPSIEATAS